GGAGLGFLHAAAILDGLKADHGRNPRALAIHQQGRNANRPGYSVEAGIRQAAPGIPFHEPSPPGPSLQDIQHLRANPLIAGEAVPLDDKSWSDKKCGPTLGRTNRSTASRNPRARSFPLHPLHAMWATPNLRRPG